MAGSKLKRFLLIYASQTGQAKAIAEEIAEKAPTYGLEAEVQCLSLTEKKFWLERERLVVVITSTTGDGDPPDTAGKFYRRLKKKTLPSDHLAHLRFSLLGLGDSNYSNFCNCGKMMNARLLELGAKPFHNPAFADDAVGLEIEVEPWIEGLWAPLKEEVERLENTPSVNKCEGATPEIRNSAINGEIISGAAGDRNVLRAEPKLQNDNTPNSAKLNGEVIKDETQSTQLTADNSATNQTAEVGENISNNNPGTDSKGEKADSKGKTTNVKSGDQTGAPNNAGESAKLESGDCAADSGQVESLQRSAPPLSESPLNVPALPPAFIKMTFLPEESVGDLSTLPIQNGCAFPSAKSNVTMATILRTEQITTDGAVKRTLGLTLDIANCGWGYEPGDSFGIVCQNSGEEVQQLISRLNCENIADKPYTLEVIEGTKKKKPSIPEYIPESATLRHILTHCLDFRSVPKKAFLRCLVEHTSNITEKRRLQELCSRQGNVHFATYIRDPGLGLLDVLDAFPSCLPTPASLIEQLPRLQARPYSASSCFQTTPGWLSCAFNVIDIPAGSVRSRSRSGVCTGWIDRITKGIQRKTAQREGVQTIEERVVDLSLDELPKIPIHLRSNQNFRLPEDTRKPIVMIGPGTGVAPFIGFLQKREWLKAQGSELGASWLFYGCRHRDKDFLFREEMERFRDTGVLTHLCVCFSREEQDSHKPRYVQDNIRRNAEALVKLLDEQETVVYVCGDAKGMARDVTQAFVHILTQVKGLDMLDAEGYLMQKRLNKTYLEDVWT